MGDLLEFHRHLFLKKRISGRNGAEKLLLISARHKVTPCSNNQRQQPIYDMNLYIYLFIFYKNTERL